MMRLTVGPSSRAARASATLTVLTLLLLVATAGLALGAARTKSCAQISGCATVVISTPSPTATLGGPIPPTSRFGVAVTTPPTLTLTTGSQPGKLVTNALLGRRIRCNGYVPRAPATFAFKLLTATPVLLLESVTVVIFSMQGTSARPAGGSGRLHMGSSPACPRVPSGRRVAGAGVPDAVLKRKLAARQKPMPWAVVFVIVSVMS